MTLKISAKNPRVLVNEMGEEVLTFTGLHLDDLREVVHRVNNFGEWFADEGELCYTGEPKKSVEI